MSLGALLIVIDNGLEGCFLDQKHSSKTFLKLMNIHISININN
jgi:hypothetical protein